MPRYCEFGPYRIANIYARECALLAIECQNCGHPFLVALDEREANENVIRMPGEEAPWRTLADIIRSHEIEYRDPPNIGCCHVGASMTSVTRRVIEYWRRDRDWQRDRSLEIEIPDTGV